MAFIFHAEVWPMPISVSPTQADFLPAEMAWPIKPDTLSSFVVCDQGGKVVDEGYKLEDIPGHQR